MSPHRRRTLRIDDPIAGDACHVARPGSPESASGRLRHIALQDIHPNPAQPRKHFHDASLAALAASIRERGVLQPVVVQPRSAGGYELIAGERRWRASKLAGSSTIPALVGEPVGGAESIELALIENVAREDLGVIEEARTIRAPRRTGRHGDKSRSSAGSQSQRPCAHGPLLDLPAAALDLIDAGEVSKGHGKALLIEPDAAVADDLAPGPERPCAATAAMVPGPGSRRRRSCPICGAVVCGSSGGTGHWRPPARTHPRPHSSAASQPLAWLGTLPRWLPL